MSTNSDMASLTIDDMSDVLLPIVKAIEILVGQLESLVDASCQSTNISEESADLLADIGNTALRHSRALMKEVIGRRQGGKGSRLLIPHQR